MLRILNYFLFFLVSLTDCHQWEGTKAVYILSGQHILNPDTIRINISFKVKNPSLQEGLMEAKRKLQHLKQLTEQYCHIEKEVEGICELRNEGNQYQIQTQYINLLGSKTFKNFVIKYQLTILIQNPQNFAQLVDQLNSIDNMIVGPISWYDMKPELAEEQIIDNGLARAKQICSGLGLDLIKIKSLIQIQQISQSQDIDVEQEQSQEQEQQAQSKQFSFNSNQQNDQSFSKAFKFTIDCGNLFNHDQQIHKKSKIQMSDL